MPVQNKIVLITYADSLGANLAELDELLERHFRDSPGRTAVGGIHILPFFPSSADRGFSPIRYDEVDAAFGSWSDVSRLGARYELTVDFMINHISRRSPYFDDFVQHGEASRYAGMFIRYKDFWPGGEPTEEELGRIYKRKPRPPFVEVAFADGSHDRIWCTFDSEQIDLDLRKQVTRDFARDTLLSLADRGARIIRLDAFAYAVKRPGTSCFFVEPEVWELLAWARDLLAPRGVEILPEIHEHYSIQLKLAEQGYWVYDFALPMLLLHTLYLGSNERLVEWLRICPRKQFTTLDTHDGIGVVDVRGLLSEEEIENLRDELFSRHANVKQIYNTPAYNNLDIYQINCTYYSALGGDDDAYLLARAIQFFAPGVPQVYYVGLLAGANDIELVESTKTGRDINRHRYTVEETEAAVARPVVRRLINLMVFRNSHPAFGGALQIVPTHSTEELHLVRRDGRQYAELVADLRAHTFDIRFSDPATGEEQRLEGV